MPLSCREDFIPFAATINEHVVAQWLPFVIDFGIDSRRVKMTWMHSYKNISWTWKWHVYMIRGLRIFPASRRYFSRFQDFFRVDLVFFPFPVFFSFLGILSASAGIFFRSSRICFSRRTIFFRLEKNPRRMVFLRIRHFSRFQKNLLPKMFSRFGAKFDKGAASKNFPLPKNILPLWRQNCRKEKQEANSKHKVASRQKQTKAQAKAQAKTQASKQASKQARKQTSERATTKQRNAKKRAKVS